MLTYAEISHLMYIQGAMKYAQETYIKIGNTAELMNVYMESDKWDEAFSLLDRHPEMADRLSRMLTYADVC